MNQFAARVDGSFDVSVYHPQAGYLLLHPNMRKAGNAILILFNRVQRSSGRGTHAMAAQESAHHRGRCRLRGCSESPAGCRLVNAGAVAVEWDRLVLGSSCRRIAYAESGEGDNEKSSHICLPMVLP